MRCTATECTDFTLVSTVILEIWREDISLNAKIDILYVTCTSVNSSFPVFLPTLGADYVHISALQVPPDRELYTMAGNWPPIATKTSPHRPIFLPNSHNYPA